MERTSYGGWPNCYRLSNGLIDLVVTADVGPRIIRLGAAFALLIASDKYQWALRLADLPMVAFALALVGAGVLLGLVALLTRATVRNGLGNAPGVLAIIVIAGLIACEPSTEEKDQAAVARL